MIFHYFAHKHDPSTRNARNNGPKAHKRAKTEKKNNKQNSKSLPLNSQLCCFFSSVMVKRYFLGARLSFLFPVKSFRPINYNQTISNGNRGVAHTETNPQGRKLREKLLKKSVHSISWAFDWLSREESAEVDNGVRAARWRARLLVFVPSPTQPTTCVTLNWKNCHSWNINRGPTEKVSESTH